MTVRLILSFDPKVKNASGLKGFFFLIKKGKTLRRNLIVWLSIDIGYSSDKSNLHVCVSGSVIIIHSSRE